MSDIVFIYQNILSFHYNLISQSHTCNHLWASQNHNMIITRDATNQPNHSQVNGHWPGKKRVRESVKKHYLTLYFYFLKII